MTKKVLITGVTGFGGSHLAEFLLQKKEYKILGTSYTKTHKENTANIENSVAITRIDLSDAASVVSLIDKERPDYIYHLAALASPGDSFQNPSETIANNITAQVNILEAVKNAKLQSTAILIVSSADVYGMVALENVPIDENTPFMPINPYAVSKIAQDFLGLQYFLSYKLPIIRVRPFNHIGPRQSPHFVVASFAKRIAEIEKSKITGTLEVGDLTSVRDFTDVRDMVEAYELALIKGTPGDVYNIGSGKGYTINDILRKMISMSKVEITIKQDVELFRPSDTPKRICNFAKFSKLTGWHPKTAIDKTLKDTLDYWRNIV